MGAHRLMQETLSTSPLRSDSDVSDFDWTSHARRWTLILLAGTVVWRLVRYGMGFPIWGDEARVMLNIVQRQHYADLLLPLQRGQAAPIGFLAVQFAVVHNWSLSEYALRLFPLLTGLAAVIFFARLAWLALPPLGAVSAIGVLAATHYATRYSLDIKPYGTDMMVSSLMLMLAMQWIRTPGKVSWLILLTLVTPIAMLFSYPAVFVAGAVSVGLLPTVWQNRTRQANWIIFSIYNAVLLASFFATLHMTANGQYDAIKTNLLSLWVRGSPPSNPFKFAFWLIDVHTAEMMSYPLGGKNGGSAGTFILCLIGIRSLWLHGQKQLLLMLGAIFALTFIAAVLRRYPYGGSARVAQHLAPPICLFVGAGIERIVQSFRNPQRQRRAAMVVAWSMLLLVISGITLDVLHPYQAPRDLADAIALRSWQRTRSADSGIWVLDDFSKMPSTVLWHVFEGVAGDESRLVQGELTPDALASHREWWVLNCIPARDLSSMLPPGYRCVQTMKLKRDDDGPDGMGSVLELAQWQRIQ